MRRLPHDRLRTVARQRKPKLAHQDCSIGTAACGAFAACQRPFEYPPRFGDAAGIAIRGAQAGKIHLRENVIVTENGADRTQRFLYSAHGDSSEVWSYAIDGESGRLTPLNAQPTGGDNSSTVTTDASNGEEVHFEVTSGPGEPATGGGTATG